MPPCHSWGLGAVTTQLTDAQVPAWQAPRLCPFLRMLNIRKTCCLCLPCVKTPHSKCWTLLVSAGPLKLYIDRYSKQGGTLPPRPAEAQPVASAPLCREQPEFQAPGRDTRGPVSWMSNLSSPPCALLTRSQTRALTPSWRPQPNALCSPPPFPLSRTSKLLL